MRRKKAFSLIAAIITILLCLSLSHATEKEQQQKKTLVSLTHSGTDPVGFMLYTLVKHQITTSDNFQLALQTEIPIIRLELITFDPMKLTLNTRIYHAGIPQFGLQPRVII